MKLDRRLVLAMLAPALALALWLGLGGVLLRATLEPAQRATLDAAIGPLVPSHGMLALLWWALAAILAAWGAKRLYVAHVAAPERLAGATRVLVGDPSAPDLAPAGSAAARRLAEAINGLARARRELQADMARMVDEASARVAHERDQLGALMAELNQSVVVCNLEGRILLYNAQARALYRRLSRVGAGGAELIGLGRSIHGVIDRALISHALEIVERRVARGASAGISARLVTVAPTGRLLQVSLAPVRSSASEAPGLTGYVLLLDDITDDFEVQSRRDRQLLTLMEASRASIASMQAALDVLDYPDLAAEERERFLGVLQDEAATMGARLATLSAATSQELMTRWPLQEMLGADLLAAVAQRIAAETETPVATEEAEDDLWLDVDSFALVGVLASLAARLVAAAAPRDLRLRLSRAGSRAHLDLVWTGDGALPDTLLDWQTAPIGVGDERLPLSVRDVVERHGGEAWLEMHRGEDGGCFRFLLPVAEGDHVIAPAPADSRPEFYDFDLFVAGAGSRAFDDQPLAEIACTVFDTETTGLDPAGGDEIIQIGAVRIVNGRLLRGETFDQLVDPQRSIPEAGIPIHGIRPEMLRGQPTIAEVLPAFHAFIGETVLVGHNVAFDMRFLQLKEAVAGVRFDQPVLDTLLLSSIVHPHETSHGLETIAARLGASVSGRHSAIGDALTTADLFLRLLPLLRQHDILTLGQARDAALKSYYARLRY